MSSRRRRSSGYDAMRNRLREKKTGQEENVIPMINVIFLLLLYFMIAGNLQPDYNVTPPFASQLAEPAKEIPTVSIEKSGKMRFENREIALEQLNAALSRITGHEKLKIHADAKVDALAVSKVMKTASEAGILQFVLVTQRRADGA